MAAFTSVTKVASVPPPAGGDGVKWVFGTAVPSASYDTGGSAIDMSGVFASKCYGMMFFFQHAGHRFLYKPTATTYATATGTVFIDDNAGTEKSSTTNIATTITSCYWIAWGTDA